MGKEMEANGLPKSPLDKKSSGITRTEYQIQKYRHDEWRTVYINSSEVDALEAFQEESANHGKKRLLELTIETKVRGLKLK